MVNQNYWANKSMLFGSINPSRAKFVASLVAQLASTSVLDLGCGDQAVKDFLDKNVCQYIPADLVSRSDDCLVIDLDQTFPSGLFHTILSIGLIGYLKNRRNLYLRVARSCRYWISSVSSASALVSRYEYLKRPYSGLSEELFVHEALEYFNLHGRATCVTGCRLFTWSPKTLQERNLVRDLRLASLQLSDLNLNTKGEWLKSHTTRRLEYIAKITETLLRKTSDPISSGLSLLGPLDNTRLEHIDVKMGDDIKNEIEFAKQTLDSAGTVFVMLTIGYSKKDSDAPCANELGRFEVDIYNEALERYAMSKYQVLFFDLTPDYDILTVFRRSFC
jgi:hypothetical protein